MGFNFNFPALQDAARKDAISRNPAVPSLRLQNSAYGLPIPLIFGKARVAGNVLWFGDFIATPHFSSTSSGGSGGSGGKGGGGSPAPNSPLNVTYTYTAAALLLLGAGVISGVTKVWRDKEVTTLADLGVTLFTGTASQAAFSFLTTNHPTEALAYRSLAYVASPAFDLSDQAQLPNFNFEVEGLNPFSVSIRDANPKDVMIRIVTEVGVTGAHIGDLSAVSNYCVANGIFVSPAYVDQRAASDCLAEIVQVANAEIVYSEDVIKVVPYSDQAATGNGATYTPNVTPIFNFDDTDFLAQPGEEPVEFDDEDTADAYNILKLIFYNRAKDYAEDVVEAQDDDHIALYGRREAPAPVRVLAIVDPNVARLVLQTELQKGLYFRRGYQFSLGPGKADLLEPMDMIAITRPSLGLASFPVRIREIEEIVDSARTGYKLMVREAPAGAGAGVLYPSEAGNGYSVDYNADPGNVNTPVILDAPAIVTDSGFEVWLAASGASANWGGCQVWVSTEAGGPFRQAGTLFGRSRHGVLSAIFNTGADPDTVNTCSVDLTISKGTLTGGTQADADNRNTLAWIEGELISFKTATLTALNKYDLKDYLRRGVFNTPIGAHALGQRFVRLDQGLFKFAYDPSLVGKTLYVKLPSFNVFGAGQQDLSTVSAYTYLIRGPIGAPDAPTGFAVSQVGQVLNFRVDPLSYLQLDRVEIRYADPGETDWNNGIPITNILRGNTDSNGSVPPGTWRFMARAFDLAGNASKTWATFDLTVSSNSFIVIRSVEESPHWLGTLTNFVLHYTGVLVPKSTKTPNDYAGNEWIDNFVPDPVATATYDAPEIDKGVDAPARIWLDNVATLGPGVLIGRANPRQLLDYRLEAGAYDGYEDWAIGKPNFRRSKTRLVLDTSVGVAKISGLKTVIDNEPATEELHSQNIGLTGTPFTFATKFHLTPLITPINDSATPLIPTHTGDSATGTTIHLFTTAPAEVGGLGGYKATGV